jgi:hypothetical protein
MRINLVGAFVRNHPFGTEIAFKKGFERLGGHELFVYDPSRPESSSLCREADVTVVFKCMDDWSPVDSCAGKKVVYQPDDLRYPHIKELMREARKHCEYALTYDDEAARLCSSDFGFLEAERLLLTADDDIYRPLPNLAKTIDFCFVGNMSHPTNHASRRKVLRVLGDAGYKVGFLDGVYDVERIVQVYNSSKVVVNHATDVGQPFGTGYGYQCRHFEVGLTKTCFLTNEIVGDDRSLSGFVTFSDEGDLISWADELIRSDAHRMAFARELYDSIKSEHLPQHRAEQMHNFFRRIGV